MSHLLSLSTVVLLRKHYLLAIDIIPVLPILASSLTLTCLSLIKSTLYPNLVIFTSETSVEFVIFFLSLQPQTALANTLVSSKLDYCNSLYSGISQTNLSKLQRIQNSLARVITNSSKYQHITSILKKLHWLPIKQRIIHELCLLTNKTPINQQHIYFYNHFSFLSHSVSTRSSDSLVLSIPYVRSSLGKRTFSVIGPQLWNSLLPDTRNLKSSLSYQYSVPDSKTHLFKTAFPSLGSFLKTIWLTKCLIKSNSKFWNRLLLTVIQFIAKEINKTVKLRSMQL